MELATISYNLTKNSLEYMELKIIHLEELILRLVILIDFL